MEEILWYTGDEEEERSAMKQEHWAWSGSGSGRNKGYIEGDLKSRLETETGTKGHFLVPDGASSRE